MAGRGTEGCADGKALGTRAGSSLQAAQSWLKSRNFLTVLVASLPPPQGSPEVCLAVEGAVWGGGVRELSLGDVNARSTWFLLFSISLH